MSKCCHVVCEIGVGFVICPLAILLCMHASRRSSAADSKYFKSFVHTCVSECFCYNIPTHIVPVRAFLLFDLCATTCYRCNWPDWARMTLARNNMHERGIALSSDETLYSMYVE
jgi:hypothetical protein